MRRFGFGLFVVLFPVAVVSAQECRPYRAPVYSAPIYRAPEPYYQQKVVGIPVVPYYYSVGEDPEERNRAIAREVLRQLGEQQSRQEVQQPQQVEVQPRERGEFRLVGVTTSGGGKDAQVLAVFNTDCVRCHKPGANRPGVQLLTADRKLFVDADPAKESRRRRRVYDSVESGEMPKGGQPLSASRKSLFSEWAQKGK